MSNQLLIFDIVLFSRDTTTVSVIPPTPEPKSVDPPKSPNKIVPASSIPAAIDFLHAGHIFTSWISSEKDVTSESIFLWYERDAGRIGSLFWTDASESQSQVKVAKGVIPLHRISDMFAKRRPKCPIPSSVGNDQCWSIVSKLATLDLQSDGEEMRKKWVASLLALITSGSLPDHIPPSPPCSPRTRLKEATTIAKEREDSKSKKGEKEEREADKSAKGHDETGQIVEKEEAEISPPAKDPIAHVGPGVELIAYWGDEKKATGTKILLFLDMDEEEQVPALYWSSPGSRVKRAECKMPLYSITDG